ncbi:MAG TPA: DNA primase, partial [Stellaceae bacterium]|nr:DNA primase [Stellaceae bacterium]
MQLQELWRLSPEPVLCFDGDHAGQRAALRALHRALPLLQPGRSLRFATLPSGEDPDSLLRAAGKPAFAEILAAAHPLSEVLWQSELAARPIDTPERRADLERRLMAEAALIADRAVQGEYRRFLRDRLFSLGRAPSTAAGGRAAWSRERGRAAGGAGRMTEPIPGVAQHAPPPPPPAGRRHRQVFLGVLLRYPALIDHWIDDLAAIDIPEPELDKLRRAILEVAAVHPALDDSTLHQHLALCGLAETAGVLSKIIAEHAGFAVRGGDDPEVIRRGLTEILQLLRARSPGDRETASLVLGADPSDENWQRLKALKDREALDGPVGGFGE